MNECDKFKQYYSSYIDGDLFPEQRKSLEEHLSKCPPCQRAVERLRLICKSLRNLPILTTSPDFELRLHQQISNFSNGHSMHFSIPINGWRIPALASIAVIAIIGIFLILNSPSNQTSGSISTTPAISNPLYVQKTTEESMLSTKDSDQSTSETAVPMKKDSLSKDTEKNYKESGMKLIDEK